MQMKNLKQFLVLAVFVLFAASVTHAQDWSKEQTEVWNVVKATWAGWKAGDATTVMASVHEKYQGWSDESPLPMGKQGMLDWYNSMKDVMKISYYTIEPARIVALKSAAVVDYYGSFFVSWDMGEDKGSKEIKGKFVEFYVKEGDKWMLLGDMMAHEEGEDEED
jgi:hypothetical protein